jgi:transcriptional regulator with PAS, ATPase and Fis domain
VIYLDHRTIGGVFKPDTLAFLYEFTDFISLAAYRALERRRLQDRVQVFEEEFKARYRFEAIVGHHPQMVKILKLIAQIADTKATVLIQGESGTGKELVARAIHDNSRRRDNPFVPINCAALPENLLESELFGYVRGAFTGAIKNKPGWFERANGGTILLDEVGEMSSALQMKLLRFLQTGEFSWVGSTEIRFCDVRIISATSRDLPRLVEEGRFREEVYYRLNVVDLWLPPLRDRKSDIPALSQHFLKMYSTQFGKPSLRLSSEVEALLMAYHFPGNVRELENIIQRAAVLAESEAIEVSHLPARIYAADGGKTMRGEPLGFKLAKQHAIETFERQYLTNCLKASGGNISRAAEMAEIDFKNFYAKMRRLGIDPLVFKKAPQ